MSLADELRKIKKHNDSFKKYLKKIKRRYGSQYKLKYRIKGTHSTIGKLRRKHISKIYDILGVMILCKSKEEIDKVARDIKQNYRVSKDKDYYKTGKSGNRYYKARHLILDFGKKDVEVQLKTKKHYALHLSTHPVYKKYGKLSQSQYNELKKQARHISKREG